MTSREVSLRTTTHGFEPSRFAARINEFTRRDRARRALRRFLPIFGVACCVVLIPPHLPWITIVTVTGAVLAFQRYREEREILDVRGTLPGLRRGAGARGSKGAARDPALSRLRRVPEARGGVSGRHGIRRSRLRHDGAARRTAPLRARGTHLPLLQPALPRQVPGRAGALPRAAARAGAVCARRRARPYTCPMHPEVRQLGPGSCPICGMALEPLEVSLEPAENPRAARHDAAVLAGGVLSAPLFVLAMSEMLPGMPLQHAVSPALLGCRAARCWRRPSCCGAAGRSSCAAGSRSSTRQLNMFTLIALGTGVAWLYSLVAVLAPGICSRRRFAATAARSRRTSRPRR